MNERMGEPVSAMASLMALDHATVSSSRPVLVSQFALELAGGLEVADGAVVGRSCRRPHDRSPHPRPNPIERVKIPFAESTGSLGVPS